MVLLYMCVMYNYDFNIITHCVLFQLMVCGNNGLSGAHAAQHVKMVQKPAHVNVMDHSIMETHVRRILLTLLVAILSSVQVS